MDFYVDKVALARKEMKRKGYTLKTTSARIGRSYQWISHILCGHEKSAPVVAAILALPPLPAKKKSSPPRAVAAPRN